MPSSDDTKQRNPLYFVTMWADRLFLKFYTYQTAIGNGLTYENMAVFHFCDPFDPRLQKKKKQLLVSYCILHLLVAGMKIFKLSQIYYRKNPKQNYLVN